LDQLVGPTRTRDFLTGVAHNQGAGVSVARLRFSPRQKFCPTCLPCSRTILWWERKSNRLL